jgi:branched-chain amino acid transport system ATP-binding protein
MMAEAILKVDNVDLGYSELKVVFNVSLEVHQGELVGLVGGNGSGKSTILRAISGMISPWSGRIIFDGEEIKDARPHKVAERGLAHVPMGRQLFPNMSVRENLMLGSYLPKARSARKQNLERVFALFPDLTKHLEASAGALSGGQQQMVAIARALMLGPKMLIMDEPSLGLAPLLVKEVMVAIRRVAETGIPILLVEQNVKQVLNVSHRTYVLENGRQVIDGPADELKGHPMVKKAYLGL